MFQYLYMIKNTILKNYSQYSLLFIIILITLFLFSNKNYRIFYIIYKTFKRDARAIGKFYRLNTRLWFYERQNATVPKIFTNCVKKHPNKVAFYFEDQVWTFKQVENLSNKIANYFKSQDFKKGDTIALVLESRPEYVCFWLGLAKIGVVTALINNNLVSDPLVHCIKASHAKAIIYGSDFVKAIKDISTNGISSFKFYQFNTNETTDRLPESVDLKTELKDESSDSPIEDIENGKSRDKLIYIYTSGTTGLPKAAVINNMRFIFMESGLNIMTGFVDDDILYEPLPLYHSAGGVIGIGQCLLNGITVVIRKKFSATNFWADCNKYNCTVAQYIGETCRFILNTHAHDAKIINHNVRFMFGNGMKAEIWHLFQEKFKIKEIYEFYGATEGNSNLINIDNKVGAVGFLPLFAKYIYPVSLIKCNEETGEAIRDKNGFCIACKPEEPGVFVGRIHEKNSVNHFAGYADKKATEKKIIENVFRKGDVYFNSGDILVQDELGYFYFKDRTGDTFRWRGENVATSEVETVISNITDFKDVVVYGVQVPGSEGRAGMAAILDTDNTVNREKLYKGLRAKLPTYAIPIFLRIMKSSPLTGTFKLKKVDLQKDGYNIHNVKDSLYIYDTKESTYVELTENLYNKIISGEIRL